MEQAEQRLSAAIDHFGDAKRFAKEARLAAELGREDEVVQFSTLAEKAAQDGLAELGR